MSTARDAALPLPAARGVRSAGLRRAGACVASATLLSVTCAPLGFAWLSGVALIPLLLVAAQIPPASAFALGTATSFLHLALIGGWLVPAGVHPAAFALGDLYSATFLGAFAALASWCRRREIAAEAVVLAAAIAGIEWLQAHLGWLAIPWAHLGSALQAVPALASLAGAAGVYGASAAIVAFSCGGVRLVEAAAGREPHWREVAWAVAVCLTIVALAQLRFPTGTPGSLRVGWIQAGAYDPRLDPPERAGELVSRYRELTLEAARERPALIVWPESAVPARSLLPELDVFAREIGADLLIAASGRDKAAPASEHARRANSVFHVSADGGSRGRYDKIRLLPFNEFVPWRDWMPWPRWISPELTDAVPGARRTAFEVRGVRFSTLICWENLFAADFQRSAREVDLVLSLTNESFVSAQRGRELLLQWNALRAAETGVPVVRVGTTGISAWIGADGAVVRRLGRGDAHETGWFVADVALPRTRTLYGRFGDATLLAFSAGLFPLLLAGWRAR